MKTLLILALVVVLASVERSNAQCVKCGKECCKAPDNATPKCEKNKCTYSCNKGYFLCAGVCFKVPEYSTPTCKNGNEFVFACNKDYPVMCDRKMCCPPVNADTSFVTCPAKSGCTLNCKKGYLQCMGSCYKIPAKPCKPWCGKFSPQKISKPNVGCDCPKGFNVTADYQKCIKV